MILTDALVIVRNGKRPHPDGRRRWRFVVNLYSAETGALLGTLRTVVSRRRAAANVRAGEVARMVQRHLHPQHRVQVDEVIPARFARA